MGASGGKLKNFFHYETVQIVRIRNVRVSLIHMLAQLAIIGYIVGYGLIYKKAYQATGSVRNAEYMQLRVWERCVLTLPLCLPSRSVKSSVLRTSK